MTNDMEYGMAKIYRWMLALYNIQYTSNGWIADSFIIFPLNHSNGLFSLLLTVKLNGSRQLS